jgi:tetratricopeptide (TPR) repeat protein
VPGPLLRVREKRERRDAPLKESPHTVEIMADAANSAQRNLYPRHDGRRFTSQYKDGNGLDYNEQLRRFSWNNNYDVPAIGQRSAAMHIPELASHNGFRNSNHFLHPTRFTSLRHSDHLSYAKSNPELGLLINTNPKAKVHDRLYLASRKEQRPSTREVHGGRLELAADVAFKNGEAEDAVPLYSKAIKATPSLYAYEKRCAGLAELGRYREALEDAQFILDNSSPADRGAALMRVKAIKDFMSRQNDFSPGYHQATTTLVCLLRPREHRQLVQSHPSTYGRPHTATKFGSGMSNSASMGSILGWDRDGDGNIDMDEFRACVASLGYKPRKREKEVFGSAQNRGEI